MIWCMIYYMFIKAFLDNIITTRYILENIKENYTQLYLKKKNIKY